MGEGEQDGGLQQRADREGGQETECACFLLIQIRFHKDPHDCLITRGMQRGMRWRDEAEASRGTMELINSCLPSSQLLSLFFRFVFPPNGLNMITLTVIWKEKKTTRTIIMTGRGVPTSESLIGWSVGRCCVAPVLAYFNVHITLTVPRVHLWAPGFSASLIDSKNHILITPHTEDWQVARHKAKTLLSLRLTLCVLTYWMNDLETHWEILQGRWSGY